MAKKRMWKLILFGLLLPCLAWAHSGGLDANSGHFNRKMGQYHYHRQPAAAATPTASVKTLFEAGDRSSEVQTQTVYVTRTGSKCHRDGCRYLKSRIPVSLKAAKDRGYSPCKVCWPLN